ncbi:GntR family transcriptional regulator [Vibrio hangzhouensis]|uniref:GntR family transcriptional regulator n=1 Tax=Vibrio hangzhouensis TaxID=462991 RepID=A0A1H5SHF0_9VIBR|nr:GntR family transcriptional regulator [Vibrio hangzhouensis]SEF50046.1 GntR family transcriptional regulator [Vibrio hangzhouensis]
MVKYQGIYNELKTRILSGYYSSEQKLPDGKSLASEFNCSEITIKKAMDFLVKDGLVVRKRGSGSFVKPLSGGVSDSHLLGTKRRAEDRGKTVNTRVIKFSQLAADETIADKLKCKVGDPVYDITRVRVLDGVPSIIEYIYLSAGIVPSLSVDHVKTSIYGYISDHLNLNIHSANLRITIGHATPEEGDLLGLPVGEHLVNVTQNAYLDNGQVFEYSLAKHTCDSYEFSTTYVKSDTQL